jgi:hypothetical protein
LIAYLGGERDDDDWLEHVRTFFEDVSHEAMLRFMVTHALPAARLLDTYRRISDDDGQRNDGLDRWLAELADAA